MCASPHSRMTCAIGGRHPNAKSHLLVLPLGRLTREAHHPALSLPLRFVTLGSLVLHRFDPSEVRRSILDKPTGRPRDQLETWFPGAEERRPSSLDAYYRTKGTPLYSGRTSCMANGNANGRLRSALDTTIASVAEANEFVACNDKDLGDITVVNPLSESER